MVKPKLVAQKWWHSKSKYYQDFIKKTSTTWVLTAGVMSLVLTVNNPVTFFAFLLIAMYATYEFYKTWQLEEMTKSFHEVLKQARDNLCETCPYITMSTGGTPPVCYKKVSRGEAVCLLSLLDHPRDERVVISSHKTD